MGNIQKKLTGKSEGGKRSERGAPRRGRSPGAGSDMRGRPRASAAAAEGGASRHPGGERGAGDPTTAPPSAAAPLGPAGLKSQGNELFRSGQFPEATLKYSAAIAQLEPAGRRAAPAPPLGLRLTGPAGPPPGDRRSRACFLHAEQTQGGVAPTWAGSTVECVACARAGHCGQGPLPGRRIMGGLQDCSVPGDLSRLVLVNCDCANGF